jgi:hypothetical protein
MPGSSTSSSSTTDTAAAEAARLAALGGGYLGLKPTPVSLDKTPQQSLDKFWGRFNAKYGGLPWTILPDDLVAKRASEFYPKGLVPGQPVVAGYEEAAEACRKKVASIVKECKRINQKYRDPHFDIDIYNRDSRLCLDGLIEKSPDLDPRGFARVAVSI